MLSREVRARLNARYNEKLPVTLAALERVHSAICEGDDAAWQQARRLAHQISGTAASFGWPRLTDAAQAIDRPQTQARLSALAVLMLEVRTAIEQCRSTSSASAD